MSRQIVVLSGSPRKGANTDTLAAAFAEGAELAGKKVKLFRTADMRIGGCLGCEYCYTDKGVCAQKDDMLQITNALYQADALVMASPVYHASVTAQLKLAIDRFFVGVNKPFPIKRTGLLMTCFQKNNASAMIAVDMYKGLTEYKEWENASIVIVNGLNGKEDIKGRVELEQARQLGHDI